MEEHVFIEDTNALSKDDRFDGEVESIDEARLHEHSVDVGASAYGYALESSSFEVFDEFERRLLGCLRSFESFRTGIDDIYSFFERAGEGGIGSGAHDDNPSFLGELHETGLVGFARPESGMPLVLCNISVCRECCDDEYFHKRLNLGTCHLL